MRNKEGLVDDLITSIPGEWKFDEQVSQHFDTHVRKSVRGSTKGCYRNK